MNFIDHCASRIAHWLAGGTFPDPTPCEPMGNAELVKGNALVLGRVAIAYTGKTTGSTGRHGEKQMKNYRSA